MSHYYESLRTAPNWGLATEEAARAVLVVEMLYWFPGDLEVYSPPSPAKLTSTLPKNMVADALMALPTDDPIKLKYQRLKHVEATLNLVILGLIGTYVLMGLDTEEVGSWCFRYDPEMAYYTAQFHEDDGDIPFDLECDNEDIIMDNIREFIRDRYTVTAVTNQYDDNPRHFACGL
jgi:hypothetical protein